MKRAALSPAPDACPGPSQCPLYVLSHDAAVAHLGCVRDIAMPCAGADDPEEFNRLYMRAQSELVQRLKARMGLTDRSRLQ